MLPDTLLRRSSRRFDFARGVAAKATTPVCAVDRGGRFTLVNPAAERLLGWREAELIGRDLHSTIHRCEHKDRPAACQLHEAARVRLLCHRAEDVLRRKDGTTVPVSYLAAPLAADGQIAGTLFMFSDVAERDRELQALRESEERYRYLTEAAPEAMWLTDSFGYVTVANRRAAVLFGYESWQRLQGLNAMELFAVKDRPRAVQAKQTAIQDGDMSSGDFELVQGPDPRSQEARTSLRANVRVSPVTAPDGRLKGLLYVAEELPAPAEQPLRPVPASSSLTVEQAVALVLSGSSLLGEGIPRVLSTMGEHGNWDLALYWQLDSDEQVLRCGATWKGPNLPPDAGDGMGAGWSFGPGADLPGRVWMHNEAVWVHDLVAESGIMRALVASREGYHGALCFPVSAGGALQGVVELLSLEPRNPDQSLLRATDTVSAQIGWFLERHQNEKELRHRALHDSLTGLPNRSLLLDRLRRSLFVCRETGKPLALFLIDLDHFKDVNDKRGHVAGDELLRVVAQRLQGVLRDSDTVARLDGDEFAVLLPGTQEAGATVVAGKIVSVLKDPVLIDGVTVTTRGSIGIALYPDHGEDSSSLLQAADAAMYVAKRRKSGYAVHSCGPSGKQSPAADTPPDAAAAK
jgi:diguanylate cyclase (GGDEF)-like protein/PAS domain S-box-containing protein